MKEEAENKEEIKIDEEIDTKTKHKKKWPIILGILVMGLIILFTLTSYKLLLSHEKTTFLGYITKDVVKLNNVIEKIEDNKIVDFIFDGTSKSVDFDFTLNSKNISGEMIFDNNYFSLGLNNITENYLVLENKNLDKLLDKFGIEMSGLASEIKFNNKPVLLNNREKAKIYSFITNCTTDILNNLDNDNFKMAENNTLSVADENITLKSIEVQLSESDMFMVQKEALISLQDEGVLNMIINKINKISTAESVDKKEIKAEIEKYIAYLDYAKAYYDLEDNQDEYYIIYKMYYNENGVIAREIIEKYSYEGELYEDIICSLITNPNGYYEIKWFNQEGYSSAYYNIVSDKITTTDNKQNHEIKYAVEGFYVGTAEDAEDYQYVPVNDEIIYNVVVEKLDNGETNVELINSNNINKFILNYVDNSANLEVGTKYNELDIQLKLGMETTETTKEELLNNGAILINDKTQEELIAEFAKVGSKLTEIFTETQVEE